MSGMDAVIQIRNGAVKGFSIYADKSRGCAERLPLRASRNAFHSILKIRKSEVVPVNQGFLCFCESLRGCTAASEWYSSDFRSSLRTRGPSLDSRVRGNERKVSRALDDRGWRSLIRVESLGGRCRVTWRRLRYLGRGDGT